jgi:hypothetical protein
MLQRSRKFAEKFSIPFASLGRMAANERSLIVPPERAGSTPTTVSRSEKSSSIDERHYSVAELAERWNLSADTIRKLFEDEPGVLVLGESFTRRGKRRYTTLRIPESVAARVHRRLSKV